MTEPNETNEEISEELSTEELKSVSGGLILPAIQSFTSPHGSGSGMTRKDWEKSNASGLMAMGHERA